MTILGTLAGCAADGADDVESCSAVTSRSSRSSG
jgi:hypothetical protein